MKCMSIVGAALAMVSLSTFAQSPLTFEGVSQHEITRNAAHEKLNRALVKIKANNALSKKTVTVLKVNLTSKLKKVIQSKLTPSLRLNASVLKASSKLPPHIQLGMNNVPVLDQGAHGTCATFAVTGVLDALTGRGDYYSQLCSLNLGKTLAQNGFSYSGWDGQNGTSLFARIEEFGLVSKAQQRAYGCGGATEYPTLTQDTSSAMSLEDYHAMSTPGYYSGLSQTSTLLDLTKWINKDISSTDLLNSVKKSLYLGNRIVIGTLLPMTDDLGASGSFHVKNDTWLLTGALEQAISMFGFEHDSDWGGHAMIITGYDDDAVVMDSQNNPHKGVFTLRNSWGSDAGDKGNYYMTYDYLTVLSMELTEVVNATNKK